LSSRRPPLLVRAFLRLWALRREPLSEFLALASHRGDFLPNFLITQCYMAWQAAHIPRWDAARTRHVLTFSPRALARGLRPLLRGKGKTFHRAAASAVPPPDAPVVLHAIPSLEIGGSEKLALDIVEGLGHRFHMRVLTGQTVRHAAYEGFDLSIRTTSECLEDELRRRPPDLIHLHYWGDNRWTEDFLAALDRAGYSIPVVGNMNNPIAPLLHPRISHHAFVSRYASDLEPRPSGPSSVIYPGASPDAWRPAAAPPRPFPTMGMVYRLAACKLDIAAIDAMVEIVRRVPETRVLVPGGGPHLARFVDRVELAGVRANFHFLGWVPFRELPALYDRLDLYLAPVVAESFGIVVPYAMFKGVPVVAYRVGALPEILGEDRWLCTTREELVARAAAALRDRVGSRRDAAALMERAPRFSLAAMLGSYEKLYTGLLAGVEARSRDIA
jgi:glycosyltransferase involved in cell wall biosynthesis